MTSDEIYATFGNWDTPTPECASRVLMSPNTSTEVATMRATLEVAYQLALLNEQIGRVLNSRSAQVRVMVESGEWPLQVQVKNR
jgi:hypothetical protein